MWEILAQWAIFETERLRLRPFMYSDREDFYHIISNPENTTFLHPPIEDRLVCQRLLVEAFMKEPLGIWALENRSTGRMIGSIRFENIEVKAGRAEIGYFLNRAFWKQGFGSEALKALVDLAFTQLPFKELVIKTHIENRASQALAKSQGFRFYREYKGSDRYSHRMRIYRDYHYHRKDYQQKEKK